MSDSYDELAELADIREQPAPQPAPRTSPEDSRGKPDPVQNFGPTLERALQQLAQELAGLRAERDGLRLELEALRTQLDIVRSQLNDGDRFTEPQPTPPTDDEPTWFDPEPTTATAPSTALDAPADDVLAPPGVRLGEPPEPVGKPTGWVKKTLTRAAAVLAALLVAIVLLISVGPKVAPYQTFFVRSGSMEPTFNTGDLIVLGKVDASDIKKGDVITFKRPDKPGTLVTHRVVAIETTKGGKQFETKGDANKTPDAWRVPASGTQWKYKFRVQRVGYVFSYLSTPQARLALLATPAVLLGLLALSHRKPQAKAAPRTRRR